MSKIVEGAREAVAVARGEEPAAAVWINGHRYVPEAKLREAVEVIRRWHMADLTGHDGALSRARQVSEAFLATMEKPRDP